MVSPTTEAMAKTNPIAPAVCRRCGGAPVSHPKLAGPASLCLECWQLERGAFVGQVPVQLRFLRKSTMACEYELVRQVETVGRLLLFRDSSTLCVRFFSQLNGDSEVVLEEVLTKLGVARPREFLDVHIMHALPEGAAR